MLNMLKYHPVVRHIPEGCLHHRILSTLSCLGTVIREHTGTGITKNTHHVDKQLFLRQGIPLLAQIKTTILQSNLKHYTSSSRSKRVSENMKRRKLLLLESAGYYRGLNREEFYHIDESFIVLYIDMIKALTRKFVYISPELIVFIHNNIGTGKVSSVSKNRILAEDLILRQTLVIQCLECDPMLLRRHEHYLPLHHSNKNNVKEFLEKLERLLQEGVSLHDIRTNPDIFRFSKEKLVRRIEMLKGFNIVKMNCRNLKKSFVKFKEQKHNGFDILLKDKGIDDALDTEIYESLAKDIGVKFSGSFVSRVQLLMRFGFSLSEIREADASVFDPTITYILPLAVEHLRMQKVKGNLISKANSSTLQEAIRMKRRPYSQTKTCLVSESQSVVISKTSSENIDRTLTILSDLGFSKEDVTSCLPIVHHSPELIREGHGNLLANDKIPMSIRENRVKLINALNYEVEKLRRRKSYDDRHIDTKMISDFNDIYDEDDSYIKELQVVLSEDDSEIF